MSFYCKPCGGVYIRLFGGWCLKREPQKEPPYEDKCIECQCDHDDCIEAWTEWPPAELLTQSKERLS